MRTKLLWELNSEEETHVTLVKGVCFCSLRIVTLFNEQENRNRFLICPARDQLSAAPAASPMKVEAEQAETLNRTNPNISAQFERRRGLENGVLGEKLDQVSGETLVILEGAATVRPAKGQTVVRIADTAISDSPLPEVRYGWCNCRQARGDSGLDAGEGRKLPSTRSRQYQKHLQRRPSQPRIRIWESSSQSIPQRI
jgi:hypothetical protein